MTDQFKEIFNKIVNVEVNDTNKENANMSSDTPAGQMLKFASETAKEYALDNLVSPIYAQLHREGYIHIHDLDYYPTKTTTCVQYDLEDLFKKGFYTRNGFIRPAKRIESRATLATIIFQSNQAEQHGGQAISAFDFAMATGVLNTFKDKLIEQLLPLTKNKTYRANTVQNLVHHYIKSIDVSYEIQDILRNLLDLTREDIRSVITISKTSTKKETHQAMEGFIHNLNTMHSRAGNQVVFSSINYGTDTSPEGRLVIEELMNATIEGLGDGETPIFPIQIFKVKEGLNYSEEDYELALANWDKAVSGSLEYKTPNFDLLIKAVLTTSKRLFPNFLFLDAPFNIHSEWDINDSKRYRKEVSTMGCRTRVFENLNGEKTSLGRGNLSFTTINLPRLAIESKKEAQNEIWKAYSSTSVTRDIQDRVGYSKINYTEETIKDLTLQIFYDKIYSYGKQVAEQLKERYEFQKTALAKQFPFMMRNNIWEGGNTVSYTDRVNSIIDSGTLGIGFIGGHNAMVALTGMGHGISEESNNILKSSIKILNKVVEEYKEKYHLNYSVLATPAEGLSGRFTRLDQSKYGIIPEVNDRDYYVNSFHVDVKQPISSFDKIRIEAPYHALTGGGHITYIELDGEAKKNPIVILQVVKTMKDNDIGYGSINHPIDRCKACSFSGLIEQECPVCGSKDISRTRRITGYLTGDLDSWNSAKQAEEKDRVKHY